MAKKRASRAVREKKDVRWTLRVQASLDKRLIDFAKSVRRDPQDVIRLVVELFLRDSDVVAGDRLHWEAWDRPGEAGPEQLRALSLMLARIAQRVETLQQAQAQSTPPTEAAG